MVAWSFRENGGMRLPYKGVPSRERLTLRGLDVGRAPRGGLVRSVLGLFLPGKDAGDGAAQDRQACVGRVVDPQRDLLILDSSDRCNNARVGDHAVVLLELAE